MYNNQSVILLIDFPLYLFIIYLTFHVSEPYRLWIRVCRILLYVICNIYVFIKTCFTSLASIATVCTLSFSIFFMPYPLVFQILIIIFYKHGYFKIKFEISLLKKLKFFKFSSFFQPTLRALLYFRPEPCLDRTQECLEKVYLAKRREKQRQ